MQIIEATIHRIEKQQHATAVHTHLRPVCLPIDQTLERVCGELLDMYSKKLDSQGSFGSNPTIDVFPVIFDEYVSQVRTFHDLSEAALALIAKEMGGASAANGGYVLFVRYKVPPNDFLLIAMLKQKAGASIDDASLDLKDTLSIDLGLLNEAARVNITRHSSQTEPYLTFIKGPRRKDEITRYFRDALSCTNFTSSSEQTKQMITALDDFIAQRADLDEAAKQTARIEARQRLFECFKANAEEVTLQTAAAAINPAEPQEFVDYVKEDVSGEPRFGFNDRFRPDKTAVRSLKRITGTTGTVRVSFDVADLQSGAVSYNPQQDALLIRGISEALRNEVKKYAGESAN